MAEREVRKILRPWKLGARGWVEGTVARGIEDVAGSEGKMGREKSEKSSNEESETRSTMVEATSIMSRGEGRDEVRGDAIGKDREDYGKAVEG